MAKPIRFVKMFVWIIVMSVIVIVFAYPFFYGLAGSFIQKIEFGQLGALLPLPRTKWTTVNYQQLVLLGGALKPFINSLIRTAWYTFTVTGGSILMGYVLARYQFKGKTFVIVFIIVSQVIPTVLTLIPSFVMVSKIPFVGGNNWMGMGGHGLIDNPLMLYLPFGWGTLLWAFLFMQSQKSLPSAFEEAAEMDGCGFWRMMFQVVIPMQLPIIAVIAITNALSYWNDWMTPFIYINSTQFTTLTAWLGTLTASLQKFGDKNYPLVFALATISVIPPLVIFLAFQKYIIQGIASAGVKG